MFHGEAFLDDDGHGRTDIRIAAKVTKKGSDIEVDLSSSDPRVDQFCEFLARQHAGRGGDGLAYLIDADIPKHRAAAAEGHCKAGYDRRPIPAGR